MTDSYEIVMERLPEHEQGFEAAVIYDDRIGDEQLILNESNAETLGDVITVTVVSGDQVNIEPPLKERSEGEPLKIACPYCGVDAGQPCKSKYGAGEEVAIPHRSRTR